MLEITESFFIRDLQAAVRRLQALRRLGLRIAIDDFGTGFSSLNSLARLPIDVVKIDKSFIDALGTRYDAVIGAVVEVADAFDLTWWPRASSARSSATASSTCGCPYAQGYLFGKPAAPPIRDLFVAHQRHQRSGGRRPRAAQRGLIPQRPLHARAGLEADEVHPGPQGVGRTRHGLHRDRAAAPAARLEGVAGEHHDVAESARPSTP